jgi:hypothetical protein
MKNTKWIWWTLGILLVLVLIVGAGTAAYRMGYTHGAAAGQDGRFSQFMPGYHMRGFDGNFNYGMWNPRFSRFDRFDGMHGGFLPYFGILGGLFRLAVLGLIVWAVFMLVKTSGWRMVRTNAVDAPKAAEDDDKKA